MSLERLEGKILSKKKIEILRKSHVTRDNKTMSQILRSKSIIDSINLLDLERFELLFSGATSCDDKYHRQQSLKDMIKDRSVINEIHLIDIDKLSLLLENLSGQSLIKSLKCSSVINAINTKKLKLFFRYCKIRDKDIKKILINSYTVDNINSIKTQKLKHFLKMKYSSHWIVKVLRNPNVVDQINFFDIERFTMFKDHDLLLKILKNKHTNTINAIDIKKLKLLMERNKVAVVIRSNPSIVDAINLFEIKRFRLILSKGINFITLLKNENTVNAINTMNINILSILLNEKKIMKKLKTVLLSDPEMVAAINIINEEKLRLLLTGKMNENEDEWSPIIKEDDVMLLGTYDFVGAINLFEIERFKLILGSRGSLIMTILENKDSIRAINSMNINRLSMLIHSKIKGTVISEILEDPHTIATIDTIDIEKLELFLDFKRIQDFEDSDNDDDDSGCSRYISSSSSSSSSDDEHHSDEENEEDDDVFSWFSEHSREFLDDENIRIIGKRHIAKAINSFEFERFKFILLRDESLMIKILMSENAVNVINSISFEQLKTAFIIMNSKDLMSVFKCTKVNVRVNFHLAMILCKAGKITYVDYDYLKKKKGLFTAIESIVQDRIPIRQILEKSTINEGFVLNLKYLSLGALLKEYLKSFTVCNSIESDKTNDDTEPPIPKKRKL